MSVNPQTVIERAKMRGDVRFAHPELEDAYEAMTHQMLLHLYDLSVPRSERYVAARQAMEIWHTELDGSVTLETYKAPGCPEAPEDTVEIYVGAPVERSAKLMPAIFWCAGSGLANHIADIMPYDMYCRDFGAIIVCPDYRTCLNEGATFLDTMNDLYAAYLWTVGHAKELGIDSKRIAVYGGSSGGQLAIALCHRLKRYGITPKGCISDMGQISDNTEEGSGAFMGCGWDSAHVRASVAAWLEGADPAAVGPEAFPSRATVEDCVGMPPVFLHTPESDPCATAALQYAEKMLAAGSFVEVHLWGGTNHGCFEADVNHGRMWQRRMKVLMENFKDIFDYDLRREWLLED